MRFFKLLPLLVAGAFIMSCEPFEEGFGTARRRDNKGNPIDEEDSTYVDDVQESILYITAIEETENSRNIVLYANGKRKLTLRTGNLDEIGTANDQHHILGGHIITEYNSASGTVIKKDGEEFARYDRCEIIKGALISEGSIYTLGQNKSGEGFSLREDGEVIFENAVGRVWGDLLNSASYPGGALYVDNGSIVFCYYKSTDGQNSQNGVRQWFIVRDGIQTQVTPPDNITEIYDIRLINGHLCMVGCQGYTNYPVFLIDGEAHNLYNRAIRTTKDFRISTYNGEPAFFGTITDNNGFYSGVWTAGGLQYSCAGKDNFILDYKGSKAIVNYNDGAISISSWIKSEVLNGPFHFITCWNLAQDNSHIYLVANPVDKTHKPILWSDGVVKEFTDSVFVTSVLVESH